MRLSEPYYATDTRGVHFQVNVDGTAIWAHVGQAVLAQRYGPLARGDGWVDIYQAHRAEIDACVTRRVRREGPELVIVQLRDLRPDAAH